MHGQTEFNTPLLNQFCVAFVLFVCWVFCSFFFSFLFFFFFFFFLGGGGLGVVVVAVYLLFGWRFLI